MGYAFHSLRERLLLLVLFASLPVLALIAHSAIEQRAAALAAAERSAQSLVVLATRGQAQLIADTRQMLVTLSQLPVVAPDAPAAACRDLLGAIHRSNTHYTNIGVAGLDGDIYCSAVDMPVTVNIGDRSYFRRAVESGGFGIGDYQVGRVTGISAMNFGYPLRNGQGRIIGVVYAALSLSWLNNLAGSVDLPEGSTVTLIDSNGTIVARYPQPDSWVGRTMTGTPLVDAVLAHQGERSMVLEGLEGTMRLYSFAPLPAGATGNIYVTVGIPESAVFDAVHREIARNLAVMMIVMLLALAAAWYGSKVLVIRPVHAITRAARRLANGEMSARTGVEYGADELGGLARDFDVMASTLQRVNRALKTLSAGNRTLVRATDEGRLLEQMCRTIVEVGDYQAAWVGYCEDEGKCLRPVAYAGFTESAAKGQLSVLSLETLDRAGSPIVGLVRTGGVKPVRHDAGQPGFSPWPDCPELEHAATSVIFPLLTDACLVGVLVIYSRDAEAFDDEELELLDESAGDLAYGIATLRMREQHRKATETIMEMAWHDSLTGLPNHAFLEDRLSRQLGGRRGDGRSLALLFLDIDRFSEINSALGFTQGDLLLQEVARRLRSISGPGDMVARMRGDEFAMLTLASDPEEIAQNMLDVLDRPFHISELTLVISATIGIALSPDHGDDVEHLVRHADVAAREAKQSGRRFARYSAAHDVDRARSLTLAGELKHAIERGELVLYYQPKLDMRDLGLNGVEALVRWMHPLRGMIPPNEFITLAEHTGLIRPLTSWVIEAALRQARYWHQQGHDFRIAVNLSARNLKDAGLLEQLHAQVERTGARPEWLEFELTESAIMDDPLNAMKTLNSLSELGIGLYIDDFGTGYSSLAYLQRLPVDAMKIDKSFVGDMLKDRDLAKIVRSTIDLAHDLDLKVVAEGVENAEVWKRLAELGCDVAQGYFISRPLPASELERWLGQRRDDPLRYIRDCR